jgi:hypothetical protein
MIALDEDEAIVASEAIVLKSVVCRGGRTGEPLVIERLLEGPVRSNFAPLTLEPGAGSCAETLDAIPPGSLPPGPIDYRILVRSRSTVVAQERRSLRVGPPQSR